MATDIGTARLQIEFREAYYLARLARTFLFDHRIARALQADSATAVVDGRPTYLLAPGDIPDSPIESPTQFLLDRFSTYPFAPTDASRAYESLWQLLLLVDDRTPDEHTAA
jgi:hypothetical protein